MSRSLGLILVLGFAACAPSIDGVGVLAVGPALGKSDGADRADHACQVILRSVSRNPDGHGGFEVDGSHWVWLVDVDVATSLGAPGKVLYRPSSVEPWYAFDGLGVPGASAGFQRYRARLVDHTAPMPGWSGTAISRAKPELAAYAALSDGGRLFDHNRLDSDFANYTLDYTHQFQLADDGACLAAAKPLGTLDFPVTGAPIQRGALVAGGQISVSYDAARLTTCRATHNGFRFWSLDANVRFLPGGSVATGSLVSSNGATVSPLAFVTDIPAGTTSVELWFHNYTPGDCDAWDSDYSRNYQAPVVATKPAAIGWAGDWGSSFARDCQHRDGVPEPAIIDEYVRERACSFVDADVWAPGITDHPEWIFADVEWTKNAVTTHSWLSYTERVGNNARFRWSLPYELRNLSDWTTASYRFRFSSDGNSWYTIGQGAGPDGGAPRSLSWAQ